MGLPYFSLLTYKAYADHTYVYCIFDIMHHQKIRRLSSLFRWAWSLSVSPTPPNVLTILGSGLRPGQGTGWVVGRPDGGLVVGWWWVSGWLVVGFVRLSPPPPRLFRGVGPTISLGLNLDIPIHELISLLMAYQRPETQRPTVDGCEIHFAPL